MSADDFDNVTDCHLGPLQLLPVAVPQDFDTQQHIMKFTVTLDTLLVIAETTYPEIYIFNVMEL